MKTKLIKVFHTCATILLALILASCKGIAVPSFTSKQPNIVLILTDDMTFSDLKYMAETNRLIGEQGATFDQFIVSMSLCCPSRVSILRGQYPHNSQIVGNKPPAGGFQMVYRLGLEKSTVAVWLQEAGYRTALIGKYLNGYPATASPTYIPPGWDEWYVPAGDELMNDFAYQGFNYFLNENGTIVDYGNAPEDYTTDVFAGKAVDFIRRSSQGDRPFFVYVATYAPHRPSVPAPRHTDWFPDIQLPTSPSINEEDISDKSRFFGRNPLLTVEQVEDLRQQYRLRIQSLQAVDEMVAKIYTTLKETGQLDNTYIFFTSDNGYHLGEHRLLAGKNTPFEEDIRVPLLVRGPGIKAGTVIEELTSNIDLAQTFSELASVVPPDFVDGRSLVPLLKNKTISSWRKGLLIRREASIDETVWLSPIPAFGPQGEIEPIDSIYDSKAGGQFIALRTNEFIYVVFKNGDRELYDLVNDPYQLENIYKTADHEFLVKLHEWLRKLRDCRAETCREYDLAP
jgi:arylsulfatase A-like enzyme